MPVRLRNEVQEVLRTGQLGMKNLILMALDKAERLTDEELTEEFAQLDSGTKKLRLHDEDGRVLPLNDIVLAVYRREQDKRKKLGRRS